MQRVIGELAHALKAEDDLGQKGRTPDERAKIESALKAEGYTTWGKVELDDEKHWDVDDAVAADGKTYDLHLGTADLKVLKKEPDTD